MTDRIYALTVVLERDNREDDVEALCNAIAMFGGVLRVDKHVADAGFYASVERARAWYQDRLFKVLEDPPEKA